MQTVVEWLPALTQMLFGLVDWVVDQLLSDKLMKLLAGVIVGLVGLLAASGPMVRRYRAYLRGAVKPMPEASYNLLVADLAGDTSLTPVTARLSKAIEAALVTSSLNSGIAVQRLHAEVQVDSRIVSGEAINDAHARARMLLDRYNAQIMFWGEVQNDGKRARITALLPPPTP